jgi:hypothetical protein
MTKSFRTLPAYLVRLAGFSLDRLEPLRSSSAADAARALEAAAEARRAAGVALDEALARERFGNNPAFDDPAARKALQRHVKQTRTFARALADTAAPETSFDETTRVVPHVAPLVAAMRTAHAAWLAATREYADVFASELARIRGALRTLYRDDARLREAVFLESPEAYERVQQMLGSEGPRNSRDRQRERLAMMYAQRFCAKNDTNSICGPHGVAYLEAPSTAPARIDITRDDARRETYFSHWAAQRILDEAAHRAGAAAATFRLHPTARIDGTTVTWCTMDHDATTSFRRRYARTSVPTAAAHLLALLHQTRTLPELLGFAGDLELAPEEITQFLDELATAGIVLRGPMLAPGLFHPLRAVVAEVEPWPAGEGRSYALGEVAAFEDLVSSFARSGLDQRIDVYQRLARRFTDVTGAAASRGQGKHYADRSVLHEDVFVETRVELGSVRAAIDATLPTLLDLLELPLALARDRVRAWFRDRFAGRTVPAMDVHRAFDEERVVETPAESQLANEIRAALDGIRAALDVAARDARDDVATVTSDALRACIARVRVPRQPGYVSVDLLVRGKNQSVVVGEVHGFFWLPTCLLDVLPPEHRDRVVGAMRGAIAEMADGRLTAEAIFLHTQATDRRFPLAARDLQLLVPTAEAGAIDLGELTMTLEGDDIVFRRGDTEVVPLVAYTRYPFLLYTSRIAPLFDDFAERFFPDSMLPDSLRGDDVPRLCIDDVVVRRRSWRRRVAPIREALSANTEAELFRRAQAVRASVGCDECVFVSMSGEPKPVLLDFRNLFLVEAFVNMLERQAADATVRFSEVLPAPDELVARGPDGARTSELRVGFYRA